MTSGKVRIGLSGWSYKGWRGDFYPEGLSPRRELAYVTERFPTLDVNGTFYSLSTPNAMKAWDDTAPKGFVYSVKGSRFITHNKKLGNVDEPMANFMASGILELKEKLGPILWQLGGNLHFNAERVDRFLALLPRDLDDVAATARKATLDRPHSAERNGGNHRVRHVIEPRHESYFVEEMVDLARRHGVALAFSHSSVWPYTEEVTAGFVYLRLHGPRKLYSSGYSPSELERWAERIQAWTRGSEPEGAERITDRDPLRRSGRDVYVYFDNDSDGHAPEDATRLMKVLTEN